MPSFKQSVFQWLYLRVQAWRSSKLYQRIEQQISKKMRRRLEVEDFSILCSNCIGGTIYHRFGKQFKSPTVNLCFSQGDFIRFCLHLDHYLAESLCFIKTDAPYPVAKLPGDGREIPEIRILFNHYKTPEQAEEKWEERKKRILWDRLYIILYNLDGVTTEELRSLESIPCRNRVVFTCTPLPEISWSYYIKPVMSQQYPFAYLGKDLFGRRYYEKKFDIAGFLNGSLQADCPRSGSR